jgi:hypothetical protein
MRHFDAEIDAARNKVLVRSVLDDSTMLHHGHLVYTNRQTRVRFYSLTCL